MPTQLSAETEPARSRAEAGPELPLLRAELERLRLLSGLELEWLAEGEAVEVEASRRAGLQAEVRVDGRLLGRLGAPAAPPGRLEQAAALLSDSMGRMSVIEGQAAAAARRKVISNLARTILDSLTPASDRQRLCETLLDVVVRIFQSRTAALRLRDAQGGEILSVAARAAGQAPEVRAGEEQLEVPVVRPRQSGELEDLGSLRLSGRQDGSRYSEADAELARELGAAAGMLLHQGRLLEEARENGRRRRDLEVARELHSALLPVEDPRLSGIEAAGACLPAAEIGGENFSYLAEEPGTLGLILLEASGHGAGAVMASAAVRALLRAEAARAASPAAVLRSANRLLSRDLQPSGQFATALVARCSESGRRLVVASAGNPAALLWRASEGRFERLEAGGLALGIFEDAVFEQEEKELGPGDLVVAFTDGLTDVRSPAGETFSIERVCQAVMRHRRERPRTLLYRLLEEVEAFRGSHPQADDITVTLLRTVRSDR